MHYKPRAYPMESRLLKKPKALREDWEIPVDLSCSTCPGTHVRDSEDAETIAGLHHEEHWSCAALDTRSQRSPSGCVKHNHLSVPLPQQCSWKRPTMK